MISFLWLIPIIPLVSYVILALFGGKLSQLRTSVLGVGSVGISMVLSILVAIAFISKPSGFTDNQVLWTWFHVGQFAPSITLHLDALSVVMILVVTVVSFLIHLYSTGYMHHDEGFSRFFAYMNLFVGSMLILVLAGDLLLLYLGWEGVGLCSYLLIGFWYRDPANGRAARKAFIVTRVGDTAFMIGLFVLFTTFGTTSISQILTLAPRQWSTGSTIAVITTLLILGGAVGKSAQLPLQAWLPDAMAGPTPVSALIHAATMVTAGVYLIARLHVLYTLAPTVQFIVALIGAFTLLIASFSALTQWDIKRVLAYSTISQIGYMFLALGVGAWPAAIFHLASHALFKSLLFLGAGAVILAVDHEQDMGKMGGLRRELPVTFWTFVIASASLSALPLITAGFYSKDLILWHAWSSPQGSVWLWAMGALGAFVTALYAFRMVFLTFFGESKTPVTRKPGPEMTIPLIVLGFLTIVGGWIELPEPWGNFPLFTSFLNRVLPSPPVVRGTPETELALQGVTAITAIVGIILVYFLVMRWASPFRERASGPVSRYLFAGWGFDWVYDHVFVVPYSWLARADRDDVVDQFYQSIAWVLRACYQGASATQTGQTRTYAAGIGVGAAIIVLLVVFR